MLGMKFCKEMVFFNVLELQKTLVRVLLSPPVPTCTLCIKGLLL